MQRNRLRGVKRMIKLLIVFLILLVIVFGIIALKWKITTLSLTYWIDQNKIAPTDEEIKDCIRYVITHWFRISV